MESFNHAKFTEHYENEPRHPFFEAFKPEIEDFSRVSAHGKYSSKDDTRFD